MTEQSLPLLPIVLAALSYLGLGFLWYSPAMFGHEWMRLTSKEGKLAEMKDMGAPIAWSIASAFAISYALASAITAFAPQSLYECVSVAILCWIGFSAATSIGEYAFLKKPMKLFLINSGYNFAAFILIAVLYKIMI